MHHSKDPLFQILFNQLAEARLVIKAESPSFTVVSANGSWLQYSGLSDMLSDGKPFSALAGYLSRLYPAVSWENQFLAAMQGSEAITLPPVMSNLPADEGFPEWLMLEIMPIKDTLGQNTDYLVCTMHDATATVSNQRAIKQVRETNDMLLEEQKRFIKEREVNDELAAMNEEMAAANEELMATNEELFDTKENLEIVLGRLQDSEVLFRSLFEQSPVGMCLLKGEDMVIDLVNDNILKIWGREREEVIGRPHHIARPEMEGQPIGDWLRMVFETGKERINNELKMLLYDHGKLRQAYVHSVYHPLKNKNGQVTGILVILTEITDWVFARKQVELAQAQLAVAIESAELGTWSIDLESGAFVSSARFKELFGFNADEPLEMEQAMDVISEDYRDEVRYAVEEAVRNESNYELEFPVHGASDGQLRWLRATGRVYPERPGMHAHFSGTVLDITARKLEEIRKNDFIAIVSHELKTPLTSLKGYLQVIRARAGTGEEFGFVRTTVEKSLSQIEKMHSLVKGFLDVARLESAKLVLNLQYTRMDELIRDAAEEAALLSHTHQIVHRPCESIEILADKEKIAQVLGNLLSNAIKYSPLGRAVELDCQIADDEIRVSVSDQGMGIKKPELDKIFSRFYRVETKHTQSISGFGIGLYICAEIIRLHRGRIWAESETGKGSTFYFTLPLRR